MRGRWHSYRDTPLMITFHPSYLLRNQSNTEKRKVWEDMLLVLERLERPISEKQRNFFVREPAARSAFVILRRAKELTRIARLRSMQNRSNEVGR